MHIIGIICEYNPFHNGHLYHLQKIKEMFPDSLIILVLNGYFLERGEISIISKKDKTKLALDYGIDLILELPFVFGTQSADTFAQISITILEYLHCEYVVFGSELNELTILNNIVDYTIKENLTYNENVKKYLDAGLNYPTALAKALNINITLKPNDLLGISYLKAIKKNNYHLKPLVIKRTNDYLDITSNEPIISASNIRHKMQNQEDITKYVPNSAYLKNISLEVLFPYLKAKIITEHDLSRYLDVDEGINNRLKKVIANSNNLSEFIANIKSKRYTYNKIRRMLIHILVGFTKEDHQNIKLEYLKVLGFNQKGQEYLNNIKKLIPLPLTPFKNSLTYKYELTAALIYDLVTNSNDNFRFENSTKPLQK